MRVSGEEYLRVSQLRAERSVSDEMFSLGSLATAPAFAMSSGSTTTDYADRSVAHRLAEKLIEDGSDLREDVVESLRARIESGSYQVSGEQIAEMMIRRLLADRVR